MKTNEMRGVTLMELVFITMVLSALAVVAIPQFLKSLERGRATAAVSLLGAIRQSQERYKTEFLTYTTSLTDLDITLSPSIRSWKNFTLNTSSAQFTRAAGAHIDKVLGIRYSDGVLCGTFSPMDPEVNPCP